MSGSNLLKPLERQLQIAFPELRDQRAQRAASAIQQAWKLYKNRKRKRLTAALAKSKCNCTLCYFRDLCKRHRLLYLNRCATLIQATWLGHHTRKVALRDRDFRLIYRALQTANASATEETKLGYRFQTALTKLSNNSRGIHIEGDLCTMEIVTRLSPECCLKAAQSNVINMMIHILNEANRSEAHKPRIISSISILVNIAKFSKCSKYINDGEVIANVCLKMIKIHKKSDKILLGCATLLVLILRSSKLKEIITKDSMNRFTISSIVVNKPNDGKAADLLKMIKGNALKFEPYWNLKKGVKHQFTDRVTALTYLGILFGS